jgi:Patatin-like phospholipase
MRREARGRARRVGTAALLLNVSWLGGCAAVSRPASSPSAIAADGVALARADAALRDTVLARLVRRSLADDTLDVLYLSGGGQNGAWGSAFLRGWFDRPHAPMPRFDLITGVSTGALQAPFVLQGAAPPLDTLRSLYLASADRFAPSIDWFFWLRRTGGVVTTKRYERTIASVMDSARVAALRRSLADDRQLLLTTTDLDLGVGRIWDIGERLQRGGAALDTVRTLLYTATAIPGIFPPRLIEGHLHADGGIVANALSLLDRSAVARLVERRRAAGRSAPLHVRVWVVMNVWTHVSPSVTSPAKRGKIYDRAFWVTFWTGMPQFLQSLEATAAAVTSGVSGATMALRIAAPPSSLGEEKGALTLFDSRWMARLDSLGVQAARSAAPWSAAGSAYARPAPRVP